MISTIENNAFQTNILALNAAVEAARAGAAVSAELFEEVRALESTTSRFRLKSGGKKRPLRPELPIDI